MLLLRPLALLIAAVLIAPATPAQNRGKRWNRMDYGPVLSATMEGFSAGNVAYKGRYIDLGEGAGVIFDTELLRVAATWTGGQLRLLGTPFDGGHGPIPIANGARVTETAPEPGWARDGRFANPRPNKYGPLPRDWARYRGFYLHGDEAVISYDVGQSIRVLEKFDRVSVEGADAIARTLQCDGIGARGATICLADAGLHARPLDDRSVILWRFEPEPGFVRIERSDDWARMGVGSPSKVDYADAAAGNGVTVRCVESIGALNRGGAPVNALIDGELASNQDEPRRCVFSDARRTRFVMDLQRAIEVQQVNAFSWHKSDRAPQRFRLFASDRDVAPKDSDRDPAKAGWKLIGDVDSRPAGSGGRHGSAIAHVDGRPLGKFRHLLFDVRKAGSGTFYTEIDVFSVGQKIESSPRRYTSTIALTDAPDGARLSVENGRVLLALPGSPSSQRLRVVAHGVAGEHDADRFAKLVKAAGPAPDLRPLLRGGPRRWSQELETKGALGNGKGAYVVDTITVPKSNPWDAWLRFGAFDFLGEDAAVLSTWNGDVWHVAGLDDDLDRLTWRRIATGLHDPLGLKVVDGVIHTLGRDGITRLHDLNGDGEIDWYENFNNDVLTTRNFHEFAFDLQCDAAGNFYFAKGGPVKPGGRGFDEIVAHHGTIMKVSKDGSELKVVATGLRAPNGISVSPDGIMTSGDNQGTWMPACRLNWLPKPGMFTSCVDTSHMDPRPTAYGDPLCWFPMNVDNSGGGQVWVDSDRWGPLRGELLHQSYGTCNLYLVLRQQDGERMQGGVAKFPLSFASAQMRARFHNAGDGQLYTCGFKGWQTRAARDTAFQRVRYTGKSLHMPRGLSVGKDQIEIRFTDPLDRELAEDVESYGIEMWNYKWAVNYGSPEYRPSEPDKKVKEGQKNRDSLEIEKAELSADGLTVSLTVPGLIRVMQMRISLDLEFTDGAAFAGDIHNTINWVDGATK